MYHDSGAGLSADGIGNAWAFVAGGGSRVLFACGQSRCAMGSKKAIGYLEGAGGSGRLAYVPGAGHTFFGGVNEAVLAELPWLFEGDERWQQLLESR